VSFYVSVSMHLQLPMRTLSAFVRLRYPGPSVEVKTDLMLDEVR